ncbi:MAG: aldo/keto reductase [Thermoplasmatales archaeon]
MKYRKLGWSGVLVSELCMGTMTFGWQADESASFKIMDKFEEEGGNFIDTANVYSDGKSEEIVGRWIKGRDRESFIIGTKVRFRTGNNPNSVGLSRKHILHSVRESLKRLGTDYVDILQLHAWDPLTPLEETLSTMNYLVQEGLIRYVGISNFRGWQLQKAIDLCLEMGWEKPVSIQPQYNLIARATEYEILPVASFNGLAVLPWSPLAGGVLTGKYEGGIDSAPKGTRVGDSKNKEYYVKMENDRTKSILKALSTISEETGKKKSQIALNWLLSNPSVTSPIIGARNVEQLVENLGASGWNLTRDQIERLNSASAIEITYPYDLRAEEQQRRDRTI